MSKRKKISKLTRFEIFKRDRFICQYCGGTPPAVILQIDHITPVAKGGDNDPLNLITSCQECNLGKTDRELTSIPPPLKAQLDEQRERREQIEQYNAFLMELREKQDGDIKEIGRAWYRMCGLKGFIFGPARIPSIRTFLKHLPKTEILDAAETAHSKVPADGEDDDRTFRYFCGVCWTKIKRAQED